MKATESNQMNTFKVVKPRSRTLKVIELGCAGHFIGANSCRWRRHTQVGLYRISSVGDLYWEHEKEKRQTLGGSPDSFFETMVFKTMRQACKNNDGCGCREVADWSEMDGERYATAGAAQSGHEKYVAKYLRIAAQSQAGGKRRKHE